MLYNSKNVWLLKFLSVNGIDNSGVGNTTLAVANDYNFYKF